MGSGVACLELCKSGRLFFVLLFPQLDGVGCAEWLYGKQVDDPQTLARAAQVSRYWNTLLQDETTWRDLLARHHHHHHHHHRYANGSGAGISGRDLPQHARAISREGMERMAGKEEEEKAWDLGSGLGPPAEPIPATNNPHPNTSTNTNTSTRRGTSTSSSLAGTSKQSKARENALGIGSGTNQASCIKRVTPFGLEKRVLNLSSGLTGLPPALPPPISPISPSPSASPQYSYKTRVKLAYLTETNWLTAGVLLAKHLSADDSVVTTLSFDETWIVVGMANSKIHVFSAFNGGWKRSLEGRGAHTQGVWAMVLVSPPHQAQTANQMQGQGQDMKRMRGTRGVMGWYGAQASTSTLTPAPASASTSTSPSASPNAWSGLDSPFNHPHPQTQTQTHTHGRENQDKGQGQSQDESEDENEGGNLCGSVRGWQGLKTSLVVSGGCDKQVKVWDVETGYVSPPPPLPALLLPPESSHMLIETNPNTLFLDNASTPSPAIPPPSAVSKSFPTDLSPSPALATTLSAYGISSGGDVCIP